MALFELGQLGIGCRDAALDALASPRRLEPSERLHQTVEVRQVPPAHLLALPARSLFRSAMGLVRFTRSGEGLNLGSGDSQR